MLDEIEAKIRQKTPDLTILTRLEPLEDSVSFTDRQLDRPVPE